MTHEPLPWQVDIQRIHEDQPRVAEATGEDLVVDADHDAAVLSLREKIKLDGTETSTVIYRVENMGQKITVEGVHMFIQYYGSGGGHGFCEASESWNASDPQNMLRPIYNGSGFRPSNAAHDHVVIPGIGYTWESDDDLYFRLQSKNTSAAASGQVNHITRHDVYLSAAGEGSLRL